MIGSAEWFSDIFYEASRIWSRLRNADKAPPPGPQPRIIVLVDLNAMLKFNDLIAFAAALQIQLNRDFVPIWDPNGSYRILADGSGLPDGSFWTMNLMASCGLSGALGYHAPEVLPRQGEDMFVGVQDARAQNEEWTVVASHEALEAAAHYLGKPEICDPCENGRKYGYWINGIRVSDFTFPAFYAKPAGIPGPYDKVRAIPGPGVNLL